MFSNVLLSFSLYELYRVPSGNDIPIEIGAHLVVAFSKLSAILGGQPPVKTDSERSERVEVITCIRKRIQNDEQVPISIKK